MRAEDSQNICDVGWFDERFFAMTTIEGRSEKFLQPRVRVHFVTTRIAVLHDKAQALKDFFDFRAAQIGFASLQHFPCLIKSLAHLMTPQVVSQLYSYKSVNQSLPTTLGNPNGVSANKLFVIIHLTSILAQTPGSPGT